MKYVNLDHIYCSGLCIQSINWLKLNSISHVFLPKTFKSEEICFRMKFYHIIHLLDIKHLEWKLYLVCDFICWCQNWLLSKQFNETQQIKWIILSIKPAYIYLGYVDLVAQNNHILTWQTLNLETLFVMHFCDAHLICDALQCDALHHVMHFIKLISPSWIIYIYMLCLWASYFIWAVPLHPAGVLKYENYPAWGWIRHKDMPFQWGTKAALPLEEVLDGAGLNKSS